jgi:hypothetical protein
MINLIKLTKIEKKERLKKVKADANGIDGNGEIDQQIIVADDSKQRSK